jgi:hypothetical protein
MCVVLYTRKEGALSPLLFSFTLECAITKVQESNKGWKVIGKHQLLVCASGVKLLGESISIVKKTTEALLDVSKEVSLEVHIEKTSLCQCPVTRLEEEIFYIKVANKIQIFADDGDKNCIHQEVQCKQNVRSAFNHADQTLLSFHLLCKNVKTKMYKTVILAVVLYGCEAWSLMLG